MLFSCKIDQKLNLIQINIIKTSSKPHESFVIASSRLFLFCAKIMAEVMRVYQNQFAPFQPYGIQFQQQMQRPQLLNQSPRDLIPVTGMDGARAYQMPANSREALFDDTDDVVIIKITDGAGFASYKRARLLWEEETAQASPNAADFVTRQEFEELKEVIMRAQQPVRKQRKAEPDEAE